jgi:hypothetical protein
VSRSDGLAGSEKIEILVRDRNQTTQHPQGHDADAFGGL